MTRPLRWIAGLVAAAVLLLGGAVLLLAGLVGALPWSVTTETVHYDGHAVAWWLPVLGLGLFTASISYVTGIAGIRRLGARVASFVGLSEVLSALFWAWLLLGELPRPVQIAGGTLIVVGVVLVKLGERDTRVQAPVSARPDV